MRAKQSGIKKIAEKAEKEEDTKVGKENREKEEMKENSMDLRIPAGPHNHQISTWNVCLDHYNAGNSVKKHSRGKNSFDPEKMLL